MACPCGSNGWLRARRTPHGGGVVEGRTGGHDSPRETSFAGPAVETTPRPAPFSDSQFDHADQTQSPHGDENGTTRLELSGEQKTGSDGERRARGGPHVPDFEERERLGALGLGKGKGDEALRDRIGGHRPLLTIPVADGLSRGRRPGQQEYGHSQPGKQAGDRRLWRGHGWTTL